MKLIHFLFVLTFIISGCSGKKDNTSENIDLVKSFVNKVINDGNIDLVDEIWAEDMQWHSAGMPDTKGRKAYKQQLTDAMNGAFTDMHLDIIDVIANKDKVVLYFTNSGTNTGDFGEYKAAGKYAKWYGMGIYRIEKGKIAEAWFVEDHYGMYKQLEFINN